MHVKSHTDNYNAIEVCKVTTPIACMKKEVGSDTAKPLREYTTAKPLREYTTSKPLREYDNEVTRTMVL